MLTIELVKTLKAEFLSRIPNQTAIPKTVACGIILSNAMRSVAGLAQYSKNQIKLNSRLLNDNPSHIRQTVAHELAHLVSFEIHGGEGTGHGILWRKIMILFGVNPDRCHALDVSKLKRKHKKHRVYCKCLDKHVKTIRYNKMIRGTVYRCGACQSVISLTKQTEANS